MNASKAPNLKVLYEDSHLIVVDKPAVMHSVSLKADDCSSLASALIASRPELEEVSPNALEAGLVHRLDYHTSGCLLVAKSRPTWVALRRCFSERLVQKTYQALVEGKLRGEELVSVSLGSPYRRAKKVRVYRKCTDKRALPAECLFRPLSYFEEYSCSIIEATSRTGRRHQVRALSAHLGHPLVGDALYGAKTTLDGPLIFPEGNEEKRKFMLHATSITFPHPMTQKSISVSTASLITLLNRQSFISFPKPA